MLTNSANIDTPGCVCSIYLHNHGTFVMDCPVIYTIEFFVCEVRLQASI